MVTVIENTTGKRAPVQQDFKMRVMLLFCAPFSGAGSITLAAGGRRDRLTTRIANTGGSSRRVSTRRNAARKTLPLGSQEWVSSQGLERIGVESSSRSL